ncbi:dephospho-CoA kinase [Paracoccus sp. (in: a-proteobacteria)]|uniref:dephospho-CoA kinase n=1 Tax=Paracoccus sp. TaxID=267 RepID=UPI00289CA352|nr:dephospho-CoA kinase [Paracoccus sp. (in: a-proteobacteria)]
MSFKLGLTGSIGMGKSTAAQMFRDLGHPVWDADLAVHQLYAPSGAAVQPVAAAFPAALAADGSIDRNALKAELASNPSALARLEALVHPLVWADRASFIASHPTAPILVFDIPLLFEGGADQQMDGVAVVSAPADLQQARVLTRSGMTQDTLDFILSRQMPDAQKRARADWIIPSQTLEGARAAIMDICAAIMERQPHA